MNRNDETRRRSRVLRVGDGGAADGGDADGGIEVDVEADLGAVPERVEAGDHDCLQIRRDRVGPRVASFLRGVAELDDDLPVVVTGVTDPARAESILSAGATLCLPGHPGDATGAADLAVRAVAAGTAWLSIGPDWRIDDLNDAAREFFDLPDGVAVGRIVWNAVPEVGDTALGAALVRADRNGRPAETAAYVPGRGERLVVAAVPTTRGVAALVREVRGDQTGQEGSATHHAGV